MLGHFELVFTLGVDLCDVQPIVDVPLKVEHPGELVAAEARAAWLRHRVRLQAAREVVRLDLQHAKRLLGRRGLVLGRVPLGERVDELLHLPAGLSGRVGPELLKCRGGVGGVLAPPRHCLLVNSITYLLVHRFKLVLFSLLAGRTHLAKQGFKFLA